VTERSKYQQNIIKNYYENRDNIALQRVQELVTELFLSEGKKRKTQWDRLEKHLLKLEVKQETIDALREKDDPDRQGSSSPIQFGAKAVVLLQSR